MIPVKNKKKRGPTKDNALSGLQLIGVLKQKTAYEKMADESDICLHCFTWPKVEKGKGLCRYCSKLHRQEYIVKRGNAYIWSHKKDKKNALLPPKTKPIVKLAINDIGFVLNFKKKRPLSGAWCTGCKKWFPFSGLEYKVCLRCRFYRDRLKRINELFTVHGSKHWNI